MMMCVIFSKSQSVREDAFRYDFSYDLMYDFYNSRNIGIVVAMITCMYATVLKRCDIVRFHGHIYEIKSVTLSAIFEVC